MSAILSTGSNRARGGRLSELRGLHLSGGISLAAAILISLGVVMSYSTTAPLDIDVPIPPLFRQHLLALGIGMLAMIGAMALPLRLWRRLALPLWVVGVVLLVLTATIGIEVNGARRWLDLGVRFQPAEIVKFTTLLVVQVVFL